MTAAGPSCEATVHVGHETFHCFAVLGPHAGRHMAIAEIPCARCGGYDAHRDDCPDVDVVSTEHAWWSWTDDDPSFRRVDDEVEIRQWRNEHMVSRPEVDILLRGPRP